MKKMSHLLLIGMRKKVALSMLIVALSAGTVYGCSNQREQKQGEQVQYYHWVCQEGEHAGAKIVFARMGDVFRGEYLDPGLQDFSSIPIMGTIDDEGNVNGVSASTSSDEIYGKLSGKITGDKFHAVWLPTPTAINEFREMEMTQEKLSSDSDTHIAGKEKSRVIPFLPQTPYTEIAYGYSIGESERRHIYVGAGSKQGEVEFHLHLVESGMNDIDIYVTGTAQLNGNTFRYNEKGYQFEVAIYNGFITVKTIAGNLNGVRADGTYPAVAE